MTRPSKIDKIIKEMGCKEIYRTLLSLYEFNKDYRKAIDDMIKKITKFTNTTTI